MKVKIHEITAKDLCWNYDDSRYPYFKDINGDYTARLDPFPSYSHSVKLIRKTLRDCINKFSINRELNVYLCHFEETSRTNGNFSQIFDYNSGQLENGEYKKWAGRIVLSGKRIPPLPSVGRYLISHEYGHACFYELKSRIGLTQDEYSKMRNFKLKIKHYGGRTWHKAIGEVIANDCRILKFGIEPEFWPHPVTRPEKLKKIVNFWKNLK